MANIILKTHDRSTISEKDAKEIKAKLEQVKEEVAKIVVGQEKALESLLRAIIARGHVLVIGLPGTAKTLLIRALSVVSGCSFSRIQFTVDLLPTDITGITIYNKDRGFEVIKGPIFSNFIIADEINRAPPKSQSALLEAMQEKQVTIGKKTYPIEPPFFVMASQNPIESAGVYPLPEAQLDRFLFKVNMGYPSTDSEKKILRTNITARSFESYKLKKILTTAFIIQMQQLVDNVFVHPDIEDYIVRIIEATRYSEKYQNLKLGKYILYGASPRASIGLFIAAKADALIRGKTFVSPQNVKNIAHEVLRHRILLNNEGLAEQIDVEEIITEILAKVRVP